MKIEKTITDPELAEIFQGITKWHANRMDKLQTIANFEDGDIITLQTEGGPSIDIDVHSDMGMGFIAGINVAMCLFEKLPLRVVVDDSD